MHVYGHPCDVERIQAIADRHGLKVIYDAAHAFGVRYRDQSLLVHGDIATLSFHATKLFHTVEGGALVTNDDEIAQRIAYMRNFGHKGQEDFWGLGVNGKNSELHAAMGLAVLPRVPELIAGRKSVCEGYDQFLQGSRLVRPKMLGSTDYNYAYYPVLFACENELLDARSALNAQDIFPRRYFYPALSWLPYVTKKPLAFAEDSARRVLCLPLYPELGADTISEITNTILVAARNGGSEDSSRHKTGTERL